MEGIMQINQRVDPHVASKKTATISENHLRLIILAQLQNIWNYTVES